MTLYKHKSPLCFYECLNDYIKNDPINLTTSLQLLSPLLPSHALVIQCGIIGAGDDDNFPLPDDLCGQTATQEE